MVFVPKESFYPQIAYIQSITWVLNLRNLHKSGFYFGRGTKRNATVFMQ